MVPEGRVHGSTDSGRLHNICTDSGRFSTTSVDFLDKHVATFAERRCRFLGCSQVLTVAAPPSTVEGQSTAK